MNKFYIKEEPLCYENKYSDYLGYEEFDDSEWCNKKEICNLGNFVENTMIILMFIGLFTINRFFINGFNYLFNK